MSGPGCRAGLLLARVPVSRCRGVRPRLARAPADHCVRPTYRWPCQVMGVTWRRSTPWRGSCSPSRRPSGPQMWPPCGWLAARPCCCRIHRAEPTGTARNPQL